MKRRFFSNLTTLLNQVVWQQFGPAAIISFKFKYCYFRYEILQFFTHEYLMTFWIGEDNVPVSD